MQVVNSLGELHCDALGPRLQQVAMSHRQVLLQGVALFEFHDHVKVFFRVKVVEQAGDIVVHCNA